MESISHALPKRSFSTNSNGVYASHKSVYDDVFGGPPKFGTPTLAPRLEDYSEIFGGFHASRSSSIPVLHLPLVDGDDADLRLDVRSPAFDYTEVFGNFGGLNFTASFQDLVGQSRVGDDSSDDPWSPAQSGSLSDELDVLNGSDKSYRLSDGDVHQSLESIKQINAYCNKSIQRNTETVLTGTGHVTNFSAVPGYTFSHYESSVSWSGEDDHCSMHAADDTNHSKEFGVRVAEEKPYRKCLSNPLHSGFNTIGDDFGPFSKPGNSTAPQDKPFITVTDISLRTRPSRLPPPSRPPPALVVKQGERNRSSSKLNDSKNCAFDKVADDGASLFFDVEVDATPFEQGREKEHKNIKLKHAVSKESTERMDTRSPTAMQVEENTKKTVRVSSNVKDDNMRCSHRKEISVSVPVIEEDRIGSSKSTEEISGFKGVQDCIDSADNSVGAVAWKEAKEYFEVVEKKYSRQSIDMVEDYDTSVRLTNQDAYGHWSTTPLDTLHHKEESKKPKVRKEAPQWDEESNQLEMTGNHCDLDNKQRKEMPNTRFIDQKGFQEKVKQNKLVCIYDSNMSISENFQQLGESEKVQLDHGEAIKGWKEAKGDLYDMEANLRLKKSPKPINIETRSVDAELILLNSGKHKQNIPSGECQRGLEDVRGAGTKESTKDTTELEPTEKQHNGVPGKGNGSQPKEIHELKENDRILKESMEHGERVNKSCIAAAAAAGEKSRDGKLACGVQEDRGWLMELREQKVNELMCKVGLERVENDRGIKLIQKRELTEERNGDALETEKNDLVAGNKGEVFERKGNANLTREAIGQEEMSGHTEVMDPTERNGLETEVKWDLDDDVLLEGDKLKVFDGGCELNETTKTKVSEEHDNILMVELTQAAFSSEGKRELQNEASSIIYESEAEKDDKLGRGNCNELRRNKDELKDGSTHSTTSNTMEPPFLRYQKTNSNICGSGMGVSRVTLYKESSELEDNREHDKKIYAENDGGQKVKSQFITKRLDARDIVAPCKVIRGSVVNERKVDDASSLLKHSGDTLYSIDAGQRIDRQDKNMKDNIAAKDRKVEERIRRQTELENEHLRKIEEEREREREREKDRMAVNRAALEARERSYIEARERAAVERATAEVRQRGMAEARERLEKASMEARLKSERAAVERANAEVRQRAAERLLAQKAASDARDRVDTSFPNRFSASFRPDSRQSTLSSDLHFQTTTMSNGLRYSSSSAHVVSEGESPQRCKARLERYRRTAERAASALAEKNRRDLLAQREREERNRIAEALDAELKRWSNGKEGNLRALLSTLQYILGPDSGWQPVPLTEVITSAAVKKAYRKATLCVHPDKLQQRGANIQQKYICEKVFDLLKEAWNKFNSEER